MRVWSAEFPSLRDWWSVSKAQSWVYGRRSAGGGTGDCQPTLRLVEVDVGHPGSFVARASTVTPSCGAPQGTGDHDQGGQVTPVGGRTGPRELALIGRCGLGVAHRLAVQLQAIGVVDQAVQQGVGDGGVADGMAVVGLLAAVRQRQPDSAKWP